MVTEKGPQLLLLFFYFKNNRRKSYWPEWPRAVVHPRFPQFRTYLTKGIQLLDSMGICHSGYADRATCATASSLQ